MLAKVIGIGTRKMILEERDPASKKLVSITTSELDENDQLIGVSHKINFIKY